MSTSHSRARGRVAVIGAGPAGMATALSVHQAGHEVVLFERYREARPAGNILNLWPAPIKALGLMGVDTHDLGAPCRTEVRSAGGHLRASVRLPQSVIDQYGGGFIGLLRPELYRRLVATLPSGVLQVDRQVESFDQDADGVLLHMADGEAVEADLVVGADGIDSMVRQTLWGLTPKRKHNLHIIGGYTFDHPASAVRGLCVMSHSRRVQGSWTSIRHEGRDGYQWWVLEAHEDNGDELGRSLAEHAAELASEFAAPLPELVAATAPEAMQRWILRDRKPIPQWSKGRATLVGDAAHATSPYAAYGAGMATEDGYFLGRRLAGIDLADPIALGEALTAFEAPRKRHTARQVQLAWALGKVFHHTPTPLQPVRDAAFNRTPLLQKVIGEQSPKEIVAQIDEIDAAEKAFVEAIGV
ncbi:hypothetical protein GOPIP_043_00210 [Gordonia polyisoprenivorans NBRC 16320 = JCM 10675]|uniref:FAD-dependent monooxygenase n=1 Tax=Gordonia polyisoprenivorans TaxID=84595 RepID=A0A846WSB3_9ACTN|nr:NAD(P)/FAD-dependent oxidoreductase [Gordonia polyisoprenivorans]MBE7193091.1 FAD-dependent monooxygenase [Gordonia polyisoprenivorans]NKY04494.1 FAD-dependent monooxygenase [Gordonia polyisoprenivorans]OZC32481.1 FAD-dependent monooxygenase [Gordonia polyisoprenivorans]UZF55892.1 FAD-dependent monooxygenase [Gordonia polyisoprenivorans]WCB37005.1 NAD(P)/FAD-dependent oxidoreductase [Gordonia polyisoprenivorans]